MNQLQIFDFNGEQVRMIEKDGNTKFVGVDIARILMYANPSKAVIDHCKGVSKLGIPSDGGIQETNVIPEGDVYRLIMKAADQSVNPAIREKAEEFEKWIFDKVLPTIRKTGSYSIQAPKTQAELLLMYAEQFVQMENRVQQVEQTVSTIQETLLHRDEDWRKDMNSMLNGTAYRLGCEYREMRNRSYQMLEDRGRCDLSTRLRNLTKRLEDAGATKTQIRDANKMDVIESDQRLKEIYTAIVKELSIGSLKLAK